MQSPMPVAQRPLENLVSACARVLKPLQVLIYLMKNVRISQSDETENSRQFMMHVSVHVPCTAGSPQNMPSLCEVRDPLCHLIAYSS